jgi:hypothetical protein
MDRKVVFYPYPRREVKIMIQHDRKNISPVAAGLTGLLIGVAGTAAVALSDKDTRKKASKKAVELKDNLKKWSEDTLHDLQDKSKDMKTESVSKIEDAKKDLQKAVEVNNQN